MIYNVTVEQIATGFKETEVTLGINDDRYDATITLKNLDSSALVVNTIGSAYKKTKNSTILGVPPEICELIPFIVMPKIKKVIFHDPATIVYWDDDTKTVVKCDGEKFDAEKGLAMAISKRVMGNKGNFNEIFKKHIPEELQIKPKPKRKTTAKKTTKKSSN